MATTIPLETFIDLDEALSAKLNTFWRKHYVGLTAPMAQAIDEGRIEDAVRLSDELDLEVAYRGGRKTIETIGVASVGFGASRAVPLNETFIASRKRSPKEVKNATEQFRIILRDLTLSLRRKAKEVIRQLEEETRDTEAELGATKVQKRVSRVRRFQSFLNTSIGKTGESNIQFASSLHTSRLSTWGATTEARLQGFTRYVITEQLDNRTCPVCEVMHGKTFEVEPAHKRVDGLLQITDPSVLKQVAPFPRQDKQSVSRLRKMPGNKIVERGWDTPPYHPRCRGVLLPDKKSQLAIVDGRDPAFVAAENEIAAAAELQAEAGYAITAEEVATIQQTWKVQGTADQVADLWRTNIRTSPEKFEQSIQAMVPEGVAVQLSVDARKGAFGSLTWSARGPLEDVADSVVPSQFALVRRARFQEGKPVTVAHTRFEVGKSQEGQGVGKRVLADSVALYRQMGVERITLNANIDVGGYAWARYGMTPIARDWDLLRREISSRLDTITDIPQKARTAVLSALERGPRGIWDIADLRVSTNGQPLGKALLLRTKWSGELDLFDPEAMARFNAYTGR